MLTPDEVLNIALSLLEARRITGRQFSAWHAARFRGLSFRDAAQAIQDEEGYSISHFTVMMDSRFAHEQVYQACEQSEEGEVRFGHTLQFGSEARWGADTTAIKAARSVRYVKKNRVSEVTA